jgi:ABC-type amino acid transport system permease subunit
VRIVLPPYGNIMIMMLKDSSQASTITVAELALAGKADRLLDVQEYQRVHARGAYVSDDEHPAHSARGLE